MRGKTCIQWFQKENVQQRIRKKIYEKKYIYTTLIFISLKLDKENLLLSIIQVQKMYQNTEEYTGQSMTVTTQGIMHG